MLVVHLVGTLVSLRRILIVTLVLLVWVFIDTQVFHDLEELWHDNCSV